MTDTSPGHSMLVNESLRQRFEASWVAGTPEPLSGCLPGSDTAEFLPTLEELIHIQLEFAWKARVADGGRPVPVQALLEEFPVLGDDDVLLRLLRQEYHCREQAGDAPSQDDYRESFPDLDLDQLAIPPGETVGPKASDDTATEATPDDQATLPLPGDSSPASVADDVTLNSPVTDAQAPASLHDDATIAGEEPPAVSIVDDDSTDTINTETSGSQVVFEPGKQVPGYELLGELGRGGMGVVYRALDTRLKRVVALKMILSGAHAGEKDLKRFQKEAEAVARLQHANIVQIHDVGEHDGQPFLSLEFVEGGGLDEKIGGEPQPPGEAAALVEQLARAVHFAHERNIVHRDLKPANVLLTAEGEPKITDFGLAKRLEEDASQTASGSIMGTPSYMAPEQAGDKKGTIGPPTDVYALGAILYCLLTGRPPFQSSSVMDTVMQVLEQEPVPPGQLVKGLDRNLETITLKCLQKSPERRYQSAEELSEELRRFQAGEPIKARPVGAVERSWRWTRRNPLATLALALVVALGIGGPLAAWQMSQQATELRKQIYRADMQLASQAFRDTNMGLGSLLIARHRETVGAHDFEWHYLKRKHTMSLSWRFKPGEIAQVAFDPLNSNMVAIGTTGDPWELRFNSGTLCLGRFDKRWGFNDGRLAVIFRQLEAVAFSDDGSHLAVGSHGILFILARNPGEAQPPQVKIPELAASIATVSFSPNGRKCLVPGTGGTLQILDVVSGKKLVTLAAHQGETTGGLFSADGKWIVSGGTDGLVKVWDAESRREVRKLEGRGGAVRAIAINAASTRIACSCDDKLIRVWDLHSGALLHSSAGHSRPATHLAYSPDSRLVISAGTDATVRLWDAETGKPQRVFKGHRGPIVSLAVSPDGLWVVTSSVDRAIRRWAVNPSDATSVLRGHRGPIASVAFSPDGEILASASVDQTVRLWTIETGNQRLLLDRHHRPVNAVVFSPDGKRVASMSPRVHKQQVRIDRLGPGAFFSDRIIVFDSESGQEQVSQRVERSSLAVTSRSGSGMPKQENHSSLSEAVAVRPDGKEKVQVGQGLKKVPKNVSYYDIRQIETGEVVGGFRLSSKWRILALGPKSRWVAVRIDSFALGNQLRTPSRLDPYVENDVFLFDTLSGQTKFTLVGHKDSVTCAAFSPDGERLATGGKDGWVKLWDTTSGAEVLALTGHDGNVNCVRFSPDGQRLASGGQDSTIRIWDGRQIMKESFTEVVATDVAVALDLGAGTRSELFDRTRATGLILAETRRLAVERGESIWRDRATLIASVWLNHLYSTRVTRPAVLAAIRSQAPLPEKLQQRMLREYVATPVVLDSLVSDETTAKMIRSELLRLAEVSREDSEILNAAVRRIVGRPNRSQVDYQRALELARKATEFAPDDGYILSTLGCAQFRLGQYDDALATLKRSSLITARQTASLRKPIFNDLLITMCQWRLGQREQARKFFRRMFPESVSSGGAPRDRDIVNLAKEAEALLFPPESRNDERGSGPAGAARNQNRQPSPEALVERLDRNKNGKLEGDELPGRMAEMLKRGDTNKDGALDKGELKKLFESFRNRGQRPGARPEGAGRRGPDGGNRPQRPEQPRGVTGDENYLYYVDTALSGSGVGIYRRPLEGVERRGRGLRFSTNQRDSSNAPRSGASPENDARGIFSRTVSPCL